MGYELLFPISGSLFDSMVTNLSASRWGIEGESNAIPRNLMKKYGIWGSFIPRQLLKTSVIIGSYYGLSFLDNYLGAAEPLDLENIYLYGAGGLMYMAIAVNTMHYITRRMKEK